MSDGGTPIGRHLHSRRAQRGSVVLWFLLIVAVLLTFGSFAIDLPHVAIARNELQNDADAAALAGASALMTPGSSGLAWAQAASATSAAISLNESDGRKLTSGTVQTGYWNMTGHPSTLQPTTITPGPYDMPAVQVTVTRAASQNGGAIPLLMGNFLGMSTTNGSATAVAVVASPSTVAAGGVFPMVIDQCVLSQYWNAQANQPTIDPASGLPYEIQIGNGKTYGGSCTGGQWTSFLTNANDVPTVQGLIANGNPSPLQIGDNIWIQPGTKTTIYSNIPTGVTVLMPVAMQVSSRTYVPIVAFAAFYIEQSLGDSDKYIQGHLVGGYTIPVQSSGVGPNYGAYAHPQLGL